MHWWTEICLRRCSVSVSASLWFYNKKPDDSSWTNSGFVRMIWMELCLHNKSLYLWLNNNGFLWIWCSQWIKLRNLSPRQPSDQHMLRKKLYWTLNFGPAHNFLIYKVSVWQKKKKKDNQHMLTFPTINQNWTSPYYSPWQLLTKNLKLKSRGTMEEKRFLIV